MSQLLNSWYIMLSDPLMQRALIVAALVGAAAPIIGVYLVQRRLSLLGDGIGHIALTGVALGWLIGSGLDLAPGALAVPGAIGAAVLGAIIIELVRAKGHTSGDLALAIMFYGGIAGGAVLIKVAGGTSANLVAYLFGSLATVSTADVVTTVALCGVIGLIGIGLRWVLLAVTTDRPAAQAAGLPTGAYNVVLAVMAALTVTTAMRVVGLLLVSALMIVPVAVAQLGAKSFGRTMGLGSGLGMAVALAGLVASYWYDLPPGATIVVLAIVLYALVATLRPLVNRRKARSQ
ncbi:MAG: metal ABC transporter permease [Micrococcales bacterium]|nr:metal ABC transporter permease [Micrococcales bacterium]